MCIYRKLAGVGGADPTFADPTFAAYPYLPTAVLATRSWRAAHRTPQLTASGESIVSSLAPRVRSFARARCELDHFRKKEHARHGWESLPSLPASKGATCSSAHDDERRGTRAVPCRHPGVVDVRGGSDFSRFDPRPERPHFSNFGPPTERRPGVVVGGGRSSLRRTDVL